jgi:hypothetical protein
MPAARGPAFFGVGAGGGGAPEKAGYAPRSPGFTEKSNPFQ